MNSGIKVFFGTPQFELSGVNTFHARLIRVLRSHAVDASFLITGPLNKDYYPLEYDPEIPQVTLGLDLDVDLKKRWKICIDYLEHHTPCIYVPGYDYLMSCISSVLSDRVGILGALHSDEDLHYDHARRLGRFWNKIICVSDRIYQKLLLDQPTFTDRMIKVSYGVSPITRLEKPFIAHQPLKIIYAGRLIHYQKRIRDLVKITEELNKSGIPYCLTVIGDGPEQGYLKKIWHNEIRSGQVDMKMGLSHRDTLECFRHQDVFVLLSDFEGLPLALLEAMAAGCIPIVSDIDSGIPEIIEPHKNGFIINQGKPDAFVDIMKQLYLQPDWSRQLSIQAVQTIHHQGFTIDKIAGIYHQIFQEIEEQIFNHRFVRHTQPPSLPSYLYSRHSVISLIKNCGRYMLRHSHLFRSHRIVNWVRKALGI